MLLLEGTICLENGNSKQNLISRNCPSATTALEDKNQALWVHPQTKSISPAGHSSSFTGNQTLLSQAALLKDIKTMLVVEPDVAVICRVLLLHKTYFRFICFYLTILTVDVVSFDIKIDQVTSLTDLILNSRAYKLSFLTRTNFRITTRRK